MIDLTKYEGHTPGEWELRHGGAIHSNGRLIADVWAGDRSREAECTANRALIAGAPELLAEVVRLRADLEETTQATRVGVAHLHEELDKHAAEITRLRADLAEAVEALRCISDLYDTDEGCRSLPQYVAARAVLDKHGGA